MAKTRPETGLEFHDVKDYVPSRLVKLLVNFKELVLRVYTMGMAFSFRGSEGTSIMLLLPY